MSPLGAMSAPSSSSNALLFVKQKKAFLRTGVKNVFWYSLLVCFVFNVWALFNKDVL
jgi:hypothetical protein